MDLSLRVCLTAVVVFIVTWAWVHVIDAASYRVSNAGVIAITYILLISAVVAVTSVLWWVWS